MKFLFANSSGGSRRGANPWIWGKNLLFGKIFAENCMKMKENGPGVVYSKRPTLDPPMNSLNLDF